MKGWKAAVGVVGVIWLVWGWGCWGWDCWWWEEERRDSTLSLVFALLKAVLLSLELESVRVRLKASSLICYLSEEFGWFAFALAILPEQLLLLYNRCVPRPPLDLWKLPKVPNPLILSLSRNDVISLPLLPIINPDAENDLCPYFPPPPPSGDR